MPFVYQGKSAHQEIADIMLMLPETIAMLDVEPGSLRRFFNQSLPCTAHVEPVVARIHEWFAFLDGWAARFPYLTKAPNGEVIITANMTNVTVGVNVLNNGEMTLPNSFVAFTAASYHALRLILLLLLRKITPHMAHSPASSTSPSYPSPSSGCSTAFNNNYDDTPLLEKAIAAAHSALDIATYQGTTQQIGGYDVLRTVFPLVIVGNLGPTKREKDRAIEILSKWGRQRGITGLITAWLDV